MRPCFSILLYLVCLSAAAAAAPSDGGAAAPGRDIRWIFVEGAQGGDFYLSATEVTFEQYDAFCDATGYEKPAAPFGRGRQPVVNVNLADALAYCDWLGKETGTSVRLPNELEWEYAARGGRRSRESEYSGSTTIDAVAWYDGNAGGAPHEAGTLEPNELGLYDMSGNVWEWCGEDGAIRGGSWFNFASVCRVSSRSGGNPDARGNLGGFRPLQKR